MILESVKDFSNSYLKNRLTSDFRHGISKKGARDVMKNMGDIGLLGPTIKATGFLGVDKLTYGLMAKEVEYIDSGYRSDFSVQSSLVMNPINEFGSEYLKKKYLPELRDGNMVGCFGLTEPNHGSDIGNLSSIAREESHHYVLTGSKTWIKLVCIMVCI